MGNVAAYMDRDPILFEGTLDHVVGWLNARAQADMATHIIVSRGEYGGWFQLKPSRGVIAFDLLPVESKLELRCLAIDSPELHLRPVLEEMAKRWPGVGDHPLLADSAPKLAETPAGGKSNVGIALDGRLSIPTDAKSLEGWLLNETAWLIHQDPRGGERAPQLPSHASQSTAGGAFSVLLPGKAVPLQTGHRAVVLDVTEPANSKDDPRIAGLKEIKPDLPVVGRWSGQGCEFPSRGYGVIFELIEAGPMVTDLQFRTAPLWRDLGGVKE